MAGRGLLGAITEQRCTLLGGRGGGRAWALVGWPCHGWEAPGYEGFQCGCAESEMFTGPSGGSVSLPTGSVSLALKWGVHARGTAAGVGQPVDSRWSRGDARRPLRVCRAGRGRTFWLCDHSRSWSPTSYRHIKVLRPGRQVLKRSCAHAALGVSGARSEEGVERYSTVCLHASV